MTKQRKVNHNSKIFETFKQVRINIPLVDAIKQVRSYAKFLKDLCTVKRKMNVKKKAFLAEQVSVMSQVLLPMHRVLCRKWDSLRSLHLTSH
jgi:hypothetical protein